MCSDGTHRIQISLRELQILCPPTIHSEVYFLVYIAFAVNFCNRFNLFLGHSDQFARITNTLPTNHSF